MLVSIDFLQDMTNEGSMLKNSMRFLGPGHEDAMKAIQLLELTDPSEEHFIGVSVLLSPKSGKVRYVALATSVAVVVLSLDASLCGESGERKGSNYLHKSWENLFNRKNITLAGFYFERLALHMSTALECEICGVDLSGITTGCDTSPGGIICDALGLKDVDAFAINAAWDSVVSPGEALDLEAVAARALFSVNVAVCRETYAKRSPRMETHGLSYKEFAMLRDAVREADLLDGGRPSIKHAEFSSVDYEKDMQAYKVVNSRYKSRIRHDAKTQVILCDKLGREVQGRTVDAIGKSTFISVTERMKPGDVHSIRIEGKESKLPQEVARDEFIRQVLLGKRNNMQRSQFIRRLWLSEDIEVVTQMDGSDSIPPVPSTLDPTATKELNEGQLKAVQAMIGEEQDVVVVHGPPGTGKTSTISAAARIWSHAKAGTWIVAYSNVGVKSIADALLKRGVEFKILIQASYYVDWHEHLYGDLQEQLIRTDKISSDADDVEKLFDGVKIVLCTLSMLSNPILQEKGIFEKVRMDNLVVDEASQLSVMEYLHIFAAATDLKKACFFGDPMQLPPYGEAISKSLESIFDLKHLRRHSLNVQYRMPTPLGDFISHEVYSRGLKSKHNIKAPLSVKFVDCGAGQEWRVGYTYKNVEEAAIIVELVQHYYKGRSFCIITPYDAQRELIQDKLKAAGLPWEPVHNVDSFQGSEADYVLISVVRTDKPGFLTSINRVNVMLTRCKAGMVIVSQERFLSSHLMRKTLLGRLASWWSKRYGHGRTWRSASDVMDRSATLPGSDISKPPGGKKTRYIERR